jgi:hypothetical protein
MRTHTNLHKIQKVNQQSVTKGLQWVGQIDDTFQEVKLDSFLKDNPTLIVDLKRKYSI